MRPVTLSLTLLALGTALGTPTIANADAIDACVNAATSGQVAQRQGRLREARTRFLACVHPECPAEVKTVCDRLLSTVETSLPTVILGARNDQGQDLVDVRVSVDGSAFAATLDGKAAAMDPGPHVLRFEQPDGAAVELRVVIREAEKNRALGVVFPSARPKQTLEVQADTHPHGQPVLGYVLGGVTLASLGVFAFLAVRGQSEYDGCNPHGCTQSTVDSLSLQRDLAFVALGVGVVSAGAATWLFVARHSPTSAQRASAVRLTFGASGRGGALGMAGQF